MAEIQDTVEQTVALESSEKLVEYLAGMQKKTFKDMSELELEDLRLPGECSLRPFFLTGLTGRLASAVTDTSLWTGPRTLDHLVEFIIKGEVVATRSVNSRD